MVCATGCAYGGGTIINAIATGHGAAFPISLKISARVCTSDKFEVSTYADVDISPVKRIVEKVAERFGLGPLSVEISGDLPTAGGLKSSSAVVNAIIIATTKLAGARLDLFDVARLNAELSRWAGISVTGAFDDAVASATGRSYLTDNYKMLVIRDLDVSGRAVVLIPPYEKRRYRLEEMRSLAPVIRTAVAYAGLGMWREAMLINAIAYGYALGYPPGPTLEALRLGAVGGVSGTGPSHVFISDEPERLAEVLAKYGKVYVVDIPQSAPLC
ncbi:shikimate kinase [Pyrobaculum islandicum DSM 4184]|uniref:Shikimate kinase n=1 Tax=Pyrobaculum islandicum (strain DSM 4184 / JCM 9189 / GEO3) TaxID=384616 RepID=A1RVF9_PYRIL|nr:shikimate kinase [Pyrobaculum islandicum]ABL88941.1 shikimate kinase [Pyrobaculum islandicum DSM 4184]